MNHKKTVFIMATFTYMENGLFLLLNAWSTMILILAIPFWMTVWIIIIVFQRYFSHANCSTINKLIFVLLTLLTCTHNGYFKQRAQFSRYGITNPNLRTDWYPHLLVSFVVIRSNLKHNNHFIFAIYLMPFHKDLC